MKKKRKVILITIIVVFILIVGYIMTFPKWLFPSLYPTYIETIESNWNIVLPIPDSEDTLYDTRGGFQGDGDAITELQYYDATNIEHIRALSNNWISGEDFKNKNFPIRVQDLLKNIDHDASYFFVEDDRFNYIILKLKGEKLTIYESYI
ncbi:hypothetical protein [Alkalibacillus haloalkaliphilus]|uniref:hypothetical protein n=1 Tax=Alkalibacillus haloalkaliphilus TaxID=94136 RepID=UPI00293615F6|nr:hypothetical protein [Alkalibacillus haloalkaliphilus]MDV2582931.1 hypothetical protein [Alkalibacillus haloalkaliphilus]